MIEVAACTATISLWYRSAQTVKGLVLPRVNQSHELALEDSKVTCVHHGARTLRTKFYVKNTNVNHAVAAMHTYHRHAMTAQLNVATTRPMVTSQSTKHDVVLEMVLPEGL